MEFKVAYFSNLTRLHDAAYRLYRTGEKECVIHHEYSACSVRKRNQLLPFRN